jgi:hypothetical protein
MKRIFCTVVCLSGAALAQSSVFILKEEGVTYLYILYGVALMAAFALFFWNRISGSFSASRREMESPENAAPPKTLDTRRI